MQLTEQWMMLREGPNMKRSVWDRRREGDMLKVK